MRNIMPDPRCIGKMEQQILSLQSEVGELKDDLKLYATKEEMHEIATGLNNIITANHNAVMALLVPLHESSLKSKSFVSGMLFVISALGVVIGVIINYVLEHFKS